MKPLFIKEACLVKFRQRKHLGSANGSLNNRFGKLGSFHDFFGVYCIFAWLPGCSAQEFAEHPLAALRSYLKGGSRAWRASNEDSSASRGSYQPQPAEPLWSGQLAGGTMIVRAADEQHVFAADQHPEPARVNVRRNMGAGQMPEVKGAVRIGHACSHYGTAGAVDLRLDCFDVIHDASCME